MQLPPCVATIYSSAPKAIMPLATAILLARSTAALIPVTGTMSTFGVAIKGMHCECDVAPPPPPAPEPRAAPNVSQYYLGAPGASCASTCTAQGLACSPLINTGVGYDGGATIKARMATFNASAARCRIDTTPWWKDNQPGFVCGASRQTCWSLCGLVWRSGCWLWM